MLLNGCSALLSEEEAEGSQPWKPAKADPWDTDGKLGHLLLGHLFERVGAQFHEPPAVRLLFAGWKLRSAPQAGLHMDDAIGVAALGAYVSLVCKACPDPPRLAWKDRNYFAYVIPAQTQEIAPAVETS